MKDRGTTHLLSHIEPVYERLLFLESLIKALPKDACGPIAAWHDSRGAVCYRQISARAIFGRSPDCDITLDFPTVSRRHFQISQAGDRVLIEDLGSANGTRLNQKKLGQQPTELGHGAVVTAGAVNVGIFLR